MNSKNINILVRLKQYKDIIVLIVFFLGGVSWIYGYFATKEQVNILFFATKEQVGILECLLEKKVTLIEAELEVNYLIREKDKKIENIYLLSTENEEQNWLKINLLKSNLKLDEGQLERALERRRNTIYHLKNGLCRRS